MMTFIIDILSIDTSIAPDTGKGDPGKAEAPGKLSHNEVVMVLLLSLDPVRAIHQKEGH